MAIDINIGIKDITGGTWMYNEVQVWLVGLTVLATRIYTGTLTPLEKGSRKANSLGSGCLGVRNRMPMPRFMKGVVKSTARSRCAVMVRSVIAKSMSCAQSGRAVSRYIQ